MRALVFMITYAERPPVFRDHLSTTVHFNFLKRENYIYPEVVNDT